MSSKGHTKEIFSLKQEFTLPFRKMFQLEIHISKTPPCLCDKIPSQNFFFFLLLFNYFYARKDFR